MLSGWTVTTTLEIRTTVLRGQVTMPTAAAAGRLVQALVAAGGTAHAEPTLTREHGGARSTAAGRTLHPA